MAVPDQFSQLSALCLAISVETDAARKTKLVILKDKLLRLVMPEIKTHLDRIDTPP